MSLAYKKTDQSSLFITKPPKDRFQVCCFFFVFVPLMFKFSFITGELVGPPWQDGATSGLPTGASVPPRVENGRFTTSRTSSGGLTRLSPSLVFKYSEPNKEKLSAKYFRSHNYRIYCIEITSNISSYCSLCLNRVFLRRNFVACFLLPVENCS